MRAVLQRVTKASVCVDESCVGQINEGWLILLAIKTGDTTKECDYLVRKVLELRAFPDENDKMNRSIVDIQGQILVVSQFTLYGDCRKGRRPGFSESADPALADSLYRNFVSQLKLKKMTVATGVFGAKMQIQAACDGPVTFLLDSDRLF